MIFPTNRFQIWDLMLFRDNIADVEHLFQCDVFCIRDGMTIVQVIIPHEYCWFQCCIHKHCTNHRMFFSIFCSIGNSFLSVPHLIIHPIHERSWFYRQFQFCFMVSHDGIFTSCHFLRIQIIMSPWSITKCFSVPYGLRGSVEKDCFVVKTNLLHRIPTSFIKFPWSIVSRDRSFPLLRRPSTLSVSLPSCPDLSSPATDFHGSWFP